MTAENPSPSSRDSGRNATVANVPHAKVGGSALQSGSTGSTEIIHKSTGLTRFKARLACDTAFLLNIARQAGLAVVGPLH